MALVPYRKRSYSLAFPAAPGAALARTTRFRANDMMGVARAFTSRRGGRYNRRGGYLSPFSYRSQFTNPVYPRPEVKAYDYTLDPVNIDNSGDVIRVLNTISAGTGLPGRIGNQVATKSVYYQYVLNFGTGPVPNAIRHILFWDKQANSSTATAADLLAIDALGTGTPNLLTTPMNLTNRDRFVILADERTTLSPNGDQIRIISGFRKINQRTTWPAPASGSDDSPQTGALLLLFVSDETVTANEPNVYGTWRIRYIDC